jgi:hypothetical protein
MAMTMVRLRVALTILALVAAVNCGGSSPSSPSAASFTGTWAGTAPVGFASAGNLQLNIAQSGSQLTGRWAITPQNASQDNGGSLTGSVNAATMSANLFASGNPCPAIVSGTLGGAGTQITGTVSASTFCGEGASGGGPIGAIVLTKQ